MMYDIVIVGNGIIGYSLAFCLKLHDTTLRIAVIGPDNHLNGATTAAGAMLGHYGEVTDATFQTYFATAKFEMALKSQNMWNDWLTKINYFLPAKKKLKIKYGTFILLNTPEEKKNFAAIITALQRYNGKYETCTSQDIKELNLINTPLQSMFLPQEGYINSHKLLSALKIIGTQKGFFDCITGTVQSLNIANNRINGVTLQNNTTYHTIQVVLAAGAYTQCLLQKYSLSIPPIFSGTGCAFILHSADKHGAYVIRTPNRSTGCGIHFLPYDFDKQLFYFGASNNIYPTPQTASSKNIVYTMYSSMKCFSHNLSHAKIVKIYTGNRPVCIDTFPLIGSTPIQGLQLLSSTFRDGLHDSPLLAEILTREILNKELVFYHPFTPVRKPITTMSREQTITGVVAHYINHKYDDTVFIEFYKHKLYIKVAKLYDNLNISYGVPTSILLMLCKIPATAPFIQHYFHSRNNQ